MVSYLKFAIILNGVDNFSKTFAKGAAGATNMAARFNLLADSVKKAALQIAALVVVSLIDMIGRASEAAAAMDKLARQAATFASGVGASVETLNENYKIFYDLLTDTSRMEMFTPAQRGELLEFLALAGLTSEEITNMSDQVGYLAYSTGTDLVEAGTIALNTMRAFGKGMEELIPVTDILTVASTATMQSMTDIGQAMKYAGPSMNAAGRSLEETATAAGLMANAGLKATQAGTSLRQVVSQLMKPTDEALKLMAKYNLQLVELTPAAKSATEALGLMDKSVEKLQVVIDSTEADIKSLQYAMDELAIGTTENQLQIMAIRLRADKAGRELTTDELDRIKKLELANDMLSYQSTELQLETMIMGQKASKASLKIDDLTKSQKDLAETARWGVSGLKPLETILREMEKLGGDNAVMYELFGVRAATAIEALLAATYKGEEGVSAFSTLLGEVTDAAENNANDTKNMYDYMAEGISAALVKLGVKNEIYTAQLGKDLVGTYIKFKDALMGVTVFMAKHGETIGYIVGLFGKLLDIIGAVFNFFSKYPELLGVLVGLWLTMKLAMPIKELAKLASNAIYAFSALRAGETDLKGSIMGMNKLALAAAGVGFAIGGIVSAYKMFTADSPRARAEAAAMTAVQWSLSAAFFAVMAAQMGAVSLGVGVAAGVAIALAAAATLYGISEYAAKMQKGGLVSGSMSGTPIIAGENYTQEAVVPLERGAIPVEITGYGGGFDRQINIEKIEVKVVDGDAIVEEVTKAVYQGVRRGISSG
jgi:TP901 family phage tail tape measure protein